MPAKEWTCQQEQVGIERALFCHVLYIGFHQKMWPGSKVDHPTSNDLIKEKKNPSWCTQLLKFYLKLILDTKWTTKRSHHSYFHFL